MKNIIIILFIYIFISGCKDKPEPNISVLIKGNWKLAQYKQDGQQWKDSTGIFYRFINDSMVYTTSYNLECARKYTLLESNDGYKLVTFPVYYPDCYFHDWYTFSVVAIDRSQMEITYLDEIGGVMVRKNEKYLKE